MLSFPIRNVNQKSGESYDGENIFPVAVKCRQNGAKRRAEGSREKDFKFLVYKSDPEVAISNLLAIFLAHGRPLSESR